MKTATIFLAVLFLQTYTEAGIQVGSIGAFNTLEECMLSGQGAIEILREHPDVGEVDIVCVEVGMPNAEN